MQIGAIKKYKKIILIISMALIIFYVTFGRQENIETKYIPDGQALFLDFVEVMTDAMVTNQAKSYFMSKEDYERFLGSANELNRLKATAYIEAIYDQATWQCDTLVTKAKYVNKDIIEISFTPLAVELTEDDYIELRQDLEEVLEEHRIYEIEEDAAKVEWVYNYTLEHCEYLSDEEYIKSDMMPNNAYVAFYEGITQCRGYASMVKELLDLLGIENKIISGFQYIESPLEAEEDTDFLGQIHVWNIVKVEDRWYHVDATIGDNAGKDNPEHFVLFGNKQASGLWHWDESKYPPISYYSYTEQKELERKQEKLETED